MEPGGGTTRDEDLSMFDPDDNLFFTNITTDDNGADTKSTPSQKEVGFKSESVYLALTPPHLNLWPSG